MMLTWLWGDSYLWRETEIIKGAILEINSEVPVKPLADTALAVFTIRNVPWVLPVLGLQLWRSLDSSRWFCSCYCFEIFFKNYLFYFMSILPAHNYVYQVCTWYSQRPEEGTGFPGTGIIGGCALPHGCWESDSGPLQGNTCS